MKCVVKVQTKSGKIGSKIFENREQALCWLNENAPNITKAALVEILKDYPGMLDWLDANREHFANLHGKDKGKDVLYATAQRIVTQY